VASLSQGRTAAAQYGLFTHKSVPVIFEPPCIYKNVAVGFTYIIISSLPPTRLLITIYVKDKGQAIPFQAWTLPESSRSLRFPDFKTTGT